MPAITRTRGDSLQLRFSLTFSKDELDDDINSVCSDDEETVPVVEAKRKVRFASTVRILHFPKLSKKEASATWLSSEEMQALKKECTFTVKCMECVNMQCFLQGENARCESRGLESQTKIGKKRKDKLRYEAKKAVLGEQQRQRCLGIFDEEAIAKGYKRLTERSIDLARKIGISDHLESTQ